MPRSRRANKQNATLIEAAFIEDHIIPVAARCQQRHQLQRSGCGFRKFMDGMVAGWRSAVNPFASPRPSGCRLQQKLQ
jgi:hypothetical protein